MRDERCKRKNGYSRERCPSGNPKQMLVGQTRKCWPGRWPWAISPRTDNRRGSRKAWGFPRERGGKLRDWMIRTPFQGKYSNFDLKKKLPKAKLDSRSCFSITPWETEGGREEGRRKEEPRLGMLASFILEHLIFNFKITPIPEKDTESN